MVARSSGHRRRSKAIVALLLVAAVLLARQAFFIEPNSLVVVEYRVELPSWPVALNGFKIAAVGDIHAGAPYVDEAKLEEMVRRISVANPDLIAWLGDYVIQEVVGGKFMDPERMAMILAKAASRHGQVAVIGNHDRWLDPERVGRAFLGAGIPFLRGSARTLTVKGVRVHVHGLDDFELSPGYWPGLKSAQDQWLTLPSNEPLLVLSHNPDVFAFLSARVTLTLAAHTHGGQVRLPLLGSLIVPSSFGQRFARGHIEEKGRHLFVNTGIGTSILPVRFGVPPEIPILTLWRAP